MILIPPERLDPQVLDAVIEAFVLREGTDYGTSEVTLADKITQVRRQIASGAVVVVFDEVLETCNLLSREDYQRALSSQ